MKTSIRCNHVVYLANLFYNGYNWQQKIVQLMDDVFKMYLYGLLDVLMECH